jgi:hypothetical protein
MLGLGIQLCSLAGLFLEPGPTLNRLALVLCHFFLSVIQLAYLARVYKQLEFEIDTVVDLLSSNSQEVKRSESTQESQAKLIALLSQVKTDAAEMRLLVYIYIVLLVPFVAVPPLMVFSYVPSVLLSTLGSAVAFRENEARSQRTVANVEEGNHVPTMGMATAREANTDADRN